MTLTPLLVSVFLDQPILAVIYLITIAVSVWLFRDSLRRGKSAFVAAGWAIGGLIFPAIVHFVYLYFRIKSEGGIAEPPISGPD